MGGSVGCSGGRQRCTYLTDAGRRLREVTGFSSQAHVVLGIALLADEFRYRDVFASRPVAASTSGRFFVMVSRLTQSGGRGGSLVRLHSGRLTSMVIWWAMSP